MVVALGLEAFGVQGFHGSGFCGLGLLCFRLKALRALGL